MALSNNLVIQVVRTSRAGGMPEVEYRAFRADGTTLIHHGGIRFLSAQQMREALVLDKSDMDEALEIVLRSALGADGQPNVATFDALGGKTFRVQSRAVEI